MTSNDQDAADVHREWESSDERQLFEALDRYLTSLHVEDGETGSQLLRQHPELRELMQCLDGLQSFALPIEVETDVSVELEAATVLLGGEGSFMHGRHGATASLGEFGRFELLEETGRGGMGVVFKARQADLDRIVALKMVLSSHLATADQIRRFHAEAKAAASLRHPNIVGIFEVGELAGQHYFAMEYIDGESLDKLLNSGSVDPDTSAECLRAIAKAVHYLHEHDLVHRDLKPSNILIGDDGSPYVTDFGLAKTYGSGDHTRTGTIVGTPSYMAPEQAAGKTNEVSPKSDVYSLGAILYEMLTGRPPFREPNPLDTLVQVLEGEPELPTRLNPQIPKELELICLKCLERDPNRRYKTAELLAKDLDRFLAREPIEARAFGVPDRVRRWARREPALVSRLGGVATAAFIVQVSYWCSTSRPAYQLHVTLCFAVWAVISVCFQRFLQSHVTSYPTRFAWCATDVVMLTLVLLISGKAGQTIGPLLIGFPTLVAASGLFFRVRLVLFTAVVSVVSYAVLTLNLDQTAPPHYPVIFAGVLLVLGWIVAYQVYRVRVLSRYFENRRLS